MRINKWIPIALAINIGVLCFALYVAMTYLRQSDIVKSEHPITNYSILEVNCRGHRMHSTVKIAYAGKDYYVGVSRELCKNIGQAEFFYDMQHDTVFEKDYLCMRHIVFFFVLFAFSLLLWKCPEVRKYQATRKDILKVRKDIFLKDALPILKEKGFVEKPFKTSNFGWNGFGYIYDMCRLRQGKFLDFVSVRITQLLVVVSGSGRGSARLGFAEFVAGHDAVRGVCLPAFLVFVCAGVHLSFYNDFHAFVQVFLGKLCLPVECLAPEKIRCIIAVLALIVPLYRQRISCHGGLVLVIQIAQFRRGC